MRGAVIYARVSTKEQVDNLSLPTQEEACRAYCEREGFRVLQVFVDEGESAKTANRPAFQEMLTYCRRQKGALHSVVVYSLSRFARDRFDHHTFAAVLHRLGISLRSVTEPIDESSTGQLMEGILSAFAQFDNDVRSERTVAGMTAAIRAGRWPFQPPVGYRLSDGKLELDPERAPALRRAFERVADGLSQASALEELQRWGFSGARGGTLTSQSFCRMLRNPIYGGRIVLPKWRLDIDGSHEPLVDQRTWNRVQARIGGSPLAAPRCRDREDFPLRRFVRCEHCGTPYTGAWSRGRSARYAYYWCRSGCTRVRKEVLEAAFVELLQELRPTDEFLDLWEATVLELWAEKGSEAQTLRESSNRRLAELKARQKRLLDAFVYRQLIDRETYERESDELAQAVAFAEVEAHDARIEEIDVEGLLAFARHIATDASRLWLELPGALRQRLQAVLFPDGVLHGENGISNRPTARLFSYLEPTAPSVSRMVSPTGFEPVLPA